MKIKKKINNSFSNFKLNDEYKQYSPKEIAKAVSYLLRHRKEFADSSSVKNALDLQLTRQREEVK